MNTTDTTQDHDAQLSALVDGELAAPASRFLLKRLEHDAVLRRRWASYHLAGACMRHAPLALMPDGFAERVSAALAAERAPRRALGGVARWTGGAAVAASVALLALLAARTPAEQVVAPEPALASSGAVIESPLREQDLRPDFGIPAQTVAATQTRELGTGSVDAGPGFLSDPRIEDYLVRHNQAVQAQGRAAFMPYVHVVSQPLQGTVRPLQGAGGAR